MSHPDKAALKAYPMAVADGQRYVFTLSNGNGDSVKLNLDVRQAELMYARLTRSFFVRCPKEKIFNEIDGAGFCQDLAGIAKKYYLCDECGFEDINLYGVKRMLKVIVEALYRYPRLRSRMCFIGTHHGLDQLLSRLIGGEEEILKRFNLQYVCSRKDGAEVATLVRPSLAELMADHHGYVATALMAFGIFDAILLDKNDYDGYAYLKVVSEIKYNEKVGFHPKGCSAPESVVYHELGHLLDALIGFVSGEAFTSFYETLSGAEIGKGLSEYALESREEFFAEAFAEFMCNPHPRPIAQKTMALYNTEYQKG